MNLQSFKEWINNNLYFTSVVALCIIYGVSVFVIAVGLLIQQGVIVIATFVSIVFIINFIIIKQASKRVKSTPQWMEGVQ